jgi:hypothetical protein
MERVGEELTHTTAKKPGPLKLIQYSMIPILGISTNFYLVVTEETRFLTKQNATIMRRK